MAHASGGCGLERGAQRLARGVNRGGVGLESGPGGFEDPDDRDLLLLGQVEDREAGAKVVPAGAAGVRGVLSEARHGQGQSQEGESGSGGANAWGGSFLSTRRTIAPRCVR